MKRYFLQTFWCAMNTADSEKVSMLLLSAWFFRTSDWKEADAIVLNTCSVRQKWEDRVFGFLEEVNKYKKSNKKNIITAITGCMVRKTWISERYLKEYKRDKNKSKKISLAKSEADIFNNDDKLFPRFWDRLDIVFRIEDLKYLSFILSHILQIDILNDYKFDDYLKANQARENPSSATIIIQTGCDNYCTYCIVPYTRWKEISRNMEDIISEAKQAVEDGAKEITLVWQNVNSYGKDFIDKKFWNIEKWKWNDDLAKSPFRQLLEELDKIEELDRIRFTSSNPHDMTKDILDAHFDLEKTCNYLHFALQSGSDDMLKKMNRRHNYNDFKKMIDYLRWRDENFSISTDIIVWFSWETENDFEKTIIAFEECEFDFTYNARYSVRTWTIAAKIYPDDISSKTKADRWHKLNDKLLENVKKRNSKMIWKIEKVLVSWFKDNYFFGRTRNFKEVYFSWDDLKIGDLVEVEIVNLDKYVLKGKVL